MGGLLNYYVCTSGTPTVISGIQAGLRQIRESYRVVVQIVLHVPPLEPRLSDGPHTRVDGRRAQNIRRACYTIRRAVEHVCFRIDVVHRGTRREAEPDACGSAGAFVRAL